MFETSGSRRVEVAVQHINESQLRSWSASNTRLSPPMGSRLRLVHRGSTLTLEIPGVGLFGRGSRLTLVFLTLWFVHASFVTYAFWPGVHASWWRTALVIPFWIVGLWLAVRTVFWMFGHTSIEVGRRGVTIERRLAAWHHRRLATLPEFYGVVCRQALRRGYSHTSLVLCIGMNDVQVEVPLSRTEQEWVVALLNDWASSLRS